jgi:hypothetical protein
MTDATLDRATELLARSDEPGWAEISGRITARLRALVRHAEPVLALPAHGAAAWDAHGSRIWVSSWVVVAGVRDAATLPGCVPVSVQVPLVNDRPSTVRVDLVAGYGVRLLEAAERVRGQVRRAVRELVGPGDPVVVDVHVVDVVLGDPTLV